MVSVLAAQAVLAKVIEKMKRSNLQIFIVSHVENPNEGQLYLLLKLKFDGV